MKTGVITLTMAFALALAFLLVAGFPPSSEAGACPDADSDTICDPDDNCLNKVNTSQTDSNTDGYGNVCDPDSTNDLSVTAADLGRLKQTFGLSLGAPLYNPDHDHNGDNSVSAADLGVLKQFFGLAPGPSGKSCAGSIPCP
ncbi:MAG: hypothetical protein OEM05_09895 [Myxococcales bacterium]|nr:hypothetical protein [Myxococcales bacterium]